MEYPASCGVFTCLQKMSDKTEKQEAENTTAFATSSTPHRVPMRQVRTLQVSRHRVYCLVCEAFPSHEHWPTTAIRKEFGSLEVGEESAICFDGTH